MVRGAHAVLCIILLMLAAPVRAEPSDILPPQDLQGSYDEATGQVNLTWMPPGNDSYTYHVYRDGVELATTTTTTYTGTSGIDLTGFATFYVQATAQESMMQSGPSNPFIASHGPATQPAMDLWDDVRDYLSEDHVKYTSPLAPCPIIGTGGPPHYVGVNEDCIPIIP